MKIVVFYPKTFHQIPEQDNPAFGNEECLMLVRECEPEKSSKRFLVLHIIPDPIESVNRLAIFWKQEDAMAFCNMKADDM